jgi:L-alanine-DL-glutamate epimerase-like enolase superfamily enzyme
LTALIALRFHPLDLELSEPFGIATGAQALAKNVLVSLCFADGSHGLGEAAPFPAVNGETQADALRALEEGESALLGASLEDWRATAARAREVLSSSPSALCAFETALLDAFCRRASISLRAFFGGKERSLESDITITTGGVEHARDAAARARAGGFRVLKVKIGGAPVELDVERLRAIAEAAPDTRLVLDGNASFTAESALELLERARDLVPRLALFEQPTAAGDHAGLAAVRRHGKVLVAADESARSAKDVATLASLGAVDVVNIKITKTGIAEALDMIGCARSHGLGLMIGGMVESRLCMSASACLAAGIGGFAFVDLDTPLFLRREPFEGGYRQTGPVLELDAIRSGHGVEVNSLEVKVS